MSGHKATDRFLQRHHKVTIIQKTCINGISVVVARHRMKGAIRERHSACAKRLYCAVCMCDAHGLSEHVVKRDKKCMPLLFGAELGQSRPILATFGQYRFECRFICCSGCYCTVLVLVLSVVAVTKQRQLSTIYSWRCGAAQQQQQHSEPPKLMQTNEILKFYVFDIV